MQSGPRMAASACPELGQRLGGHTEWMSFRRIAVAATASMLLVIGPGYAVDLTSFNAALARDNVSGSPSEPGQAPSGAQEQAKAVEPAPEVLGVADGLGVVADGQILLKPASSQHRTFSFKVKNPPEGVDRKFVLKLLPQPTGAAGQLQVRLEPEEFSLAPGQVQPVSVALADAPAAGEYSGVLLISDPERSGVQQDFTMTIEGASAPWWQRPLGVLLSIAVLVFLGAALSSLLSVYLPASLNRRQNRRRLQDLAQKMGENLMPGTPLEMKLVVERERLELLNNRIGWYSTRATELTQEVSSLTDELEQKVIIAARLDACRNRLSTATSVPPSIVPRASTQLDAAASLVARGDAEQARKIVTEVEQDLEWTDAITARVQEALTKQISETVKKKEFIEDSYIRDLVESKLEPFLREPPEILERGDLLNRDQECYSAHLYLRYKLDIVNRHQYAAQEEYEERLLRELKSGDAGLLRAAALLDDLESGVTPDEIEAALKKEPPGWDMSVHPPHPSPEQTTSFEFRFRERRIDESPLAAKMRYKWDFGDGRPPVLGKRCVHFFADPCKGEKDAYLVRVFVRDPAGNDYEFSNEVIVKAAGKRDRGIKLIEVSAFGISFLIACVLAVSFHYTGNEQLSSLNDYVTPFLWGFGLDQVKDRATSFTELMRRVPQGTASPVPGAEGATGNAAPAKP